MGNTGSWSSTVTSPAVTAHNESAFYEFTAREVDILEAATNELEKMSLAAVQHIIDNKLYTQMGIPESAVPLVESSWDAEPPSLYWRFDLATVATARQSSWSKMPIRRHHRSSLRSSNITGWKTRMPVAAS